MSDKAVGIKSVALEINGDGTAEASIVFEDAKGNVTTNVEGAPRPVWTPSDAPTAHSILELTPSPDGRSCAIKARVPNPPPSPLPTELTVTARIAGGLPGQTVAEAKTSNGLSVVEEEAPAHAVAAKDNAPKKYVLALTQP